ncbi:glycosyltransferase family 2 protein [Flavobacterium sp. TAB 87]|uniref:glycosyltransferase family 2 protein n=1 Tax=Flavobacterium sp. TAB 87 TaxID=1729581 RepID=UPI00076C6E62|nr:glycosyltransferase family A protein [Flavobacterium sp. TAB 87]KVV15888.1 mycofactocin system glycosyltransferase [Flavobacterium sp. TAB 87]
MIVIYHDNLKILSLEASDDKAVLATENIVSTLFAVAERYPDQLLIWCHISQKENLNASALAEIFHHQKIVASYTTGNANYLSNTIGYVEESPFIKINKEVSYPTWQLSTDVGGAYAAVFLAIKSSFPQNTNFAYFLQSFAKLAMPLGIFCYSEPKLLETISACISDKKAAKEAELFKFVKQHYRTRWLLLLLLNLFIYEKRIPLLAFFKALFYKKRKIPANTFDSITIQSSRKVVETKTIDVVIPTIGRKKYLYDVLVDLKNQTHLPQNVIIIEQNPDEGSASELDYLNNESWPFTIKHSFTHQAGACNARNLALAEVTSEWVFLNDDDNRFNSKLFENIFLKASEFSATVITTAYLQVNEIQEYKTTHQSGIFGSGNSFVKKAALQNIQFDKALEFGYGEDIDFGLQLRNRGHDVIYFPDLKITHLKAAIGGFRTIIKKQWADDLIQPKPSPTVLYVIQKHSSSEQLKRYKLILFLKLLKNESFGNYLHFYKDFKIKWRRSVYWASKLKS